MFYLFKLILKFSLIIPKINNGLYQAFFYKKSVINMKNKKKDREFNSELNKLRHYN